MKKLIDKTVECLMVASWFFAAAVITAGIWFMTYGDSKQIPLD